MRRGIDVKVGIPRLSQNTLYHGKPGNEDLIKAMAPPTRSE